MTAPGLSRAQWSDGARWTLCFAIAAALHAGGAAALVARWDTNDLTANPPVITVDLAPIASAPEVVPTDLPEAPPQVETPPEEPPAPQAETVVEPPKPPPQAESVPEPVNPPPPKPPERKKVAKLTTAPKPAEYRSAVAAAPAPGAGAHNSNALPNWKSQLVAQLERNKRYPSEARGDHGVAQLAFSIDRAGGVHNARIVRSSGSSALDQETLALVRRAQPLPPPPAEVAGSQIAIVVPIRYNAR